MFDRHSRFVVSACIFASSIVTSPSSFAGVFTGFESDTGNNRLSYIGGQTHSDVFLHFFAANLEYEFLDGNVLTKVDTKTLNFSLGFRLGSRNNYSLVVGPTFNDKHERTPTLESDDQSIGVFYQFGANASVDASYYEFLASFNSLDNFIWSRGKYKRRISQSYFAGAELFLMGNDDGESWGSGILLEYSGAYANAGVKAGYKRFTNNESGSYYGLEAYFPF